jgi:hypothetical protein
METAGGVGLSEPVVKDVPSCYFVARLKVLAGMIEHVETGRIITTEDRPVEPDEFRRLGPGWADENVALFDSRERWLPAASIERLFCAETGAERWNQHEHAVMVRPTFHHRARAQPEDDPHCGSRCEADRTVWREASP